MPKFRYRALDASGQMVAGVIEAASTAAVVPELEKISFLPIEITDESERAGFSLRKLFARGPTREEISGISEDLATLIKGGVTLDRALLILSETGVRPGGRQPDARPAPRNLGRAQPGGGCLDASGPFPQDLREDGGGRRGRRNARRDAAR